MKRMNLVLLLFFLAATVPPLAPAQDEQEPAGMGRMGQGFLQDLNLSDQQSKEIGKLRSDMMKEAIAHRAKIATSRVEFLELLRADQVDKALLEKKMSEVAALETQMRTARLNHWFSVNKLLNPEQQKVWKRSLLMHGSMHHQGMANRGHRRFDNPPGRGRGRER